MPRKYSENFRREAIRRVQECQTVASAAGELKIDPRTLQRWLEEYAASEANATGSSVLAERERENVGASALHPPLSPSSLDAATDLQESTLDTLKLLAGDVLASSAQETTRLRDELGGVEDLPGLQALVVTARRLHEAATSRLDGVLDAVSECLPVPDPDSFRSALADLRSQIEAIREARRSRLVLGSPEPAAAEFSPGFLQRYPEVMGAQRAVCDVASQLEAALSAMCDQAGRTSAERSERAENLSQLARSLVGRASDLHDHEMQVWPPEWPANWESGSSEKANWERASRNHRLIREADEEIRKALRELTSGEDPCSPAETRSLLVLEESTKAVAELALSTADRVLQELISRERTPLSRKRRTNPPGQGLVAGVGCGGRRWSGSVPVPQKLRYEGSEDEPVQAWRMRPRSSRSSGCH